MQVRNPPDAARPRGSESSAPASPPGGGVFAVALWFAFLGAFGELALLGVKRLVWHHQIRLGPQIVWMTPAADALLFLALALVVWIIARRWPIAGGPRVTATLFALLAAAGVAAVQRWQYPLGVVILCLGVAYQAGRLAAAGPDRFQRLVRRTLPLFAAFVALMGIGWNVGSFIRERRALAALPAARAGAPNVLLLIWDTVRASDLGLYGAPRPTSPELQRLAARGVVFDRAIATAPWTLPSHAGMFTGRYPHELSVGWLSPLDDHYPTLAEALDRHGYATAGFVANTIYAGYEYGLNRGFVHYEDYVVSPGEFVLASSLLRRVTNSPALRRLVGSHEILGRKRAADVNSRLLAWLDHRRPADRPFFAFLNEFDAHEPYLPPAPFDTLFGRLPRRERFTVANRTNSSEHEERWKMSPLEVQAEHDAYDASIAYMDAQLGALLRALRSRGLLDNTIVIVAADHGEEFGRHRVFTHGNSLYVPVLHVPLVISWPRSLPSGRRVPDAASLRDLPATITDLIDAEQGPFPGRSLARFWDPAAPGGPADASAVISEVDRMPDAPAWYPVHPTPLRSIIAGSFHLIRRPTGSEELYDLARDPLEMRNVAADLAYAPEVARLRRSLLAMPFRQAAR